jgi:3-isopropylmalate/(R)-2-methylmalate dehydratase small subunit
MKIIKGKAWTFGDFVDTDLIIPHTFLTTANPDDLVEHAFESIYDNFYKLVNSGDIIVAGKNFGTGSSREEAVFVLKEMGISVVVADSIARIYYRNLINLGILAIQIADISKNVHNGDIITVDSNKGILTNTTTSKIFSFKPFPDYILNLIQSGGALNYFKKKLRKH